MAGLGHVVGGFVRRNAVALLALFVAVGGGAFAATGGGFLGRTGTVTGCVASKGCVLRGGKAWEASRRPLATGANVSG
jgi:hypothetical protein